MAVRLLAQSHKHISVYFAAVQPLSRSDNRLLNWKQKIAK